MRNNLKEEKTQFQVFNQTEEINLNKSDLLNMILNIFM